MVTVFLELDDHKGGTDTILGYETDHVPRQGEVIHIPDKGTYYSVQRVQHRLYPKDEQRLYAIDVYVEDVTKIFNEDEKENRKERRTTRRNRNR